MKPEWQLTCPVSDWLGGLGFESYTEVNPPGACQYEFCDVVGVHWPTETLIAVELKRSLTCYAIRQASYHSWCDVAYVAVWTRPRLKRFNNWEGVAYGDIGVLSAHSGQIEVCRDARVQRPWLLGRKPRQEMLDRLRIMEPGGIAGRPTTRGEGPAIECAAAVSNYLVAHPDAPWTEIFGAVPNHYSNPKSMAGSLRNRLVARQPNKENDR